MRDAERPRRAFPRRAWERGVSRQSALNLLPFWRSPQLGKKRRGRTSMPSRIEDYALIGDCEAAALVGKDGSLDWLCLPRFDSGACFAALLGTPEHGRWQIIPAGEIRKVSRRYREGTIILETTFETDQGVVTLIDGMAIRAEHPVLIRSVRGERG